jgi:hypothetical protein
MIIFETSVFSRLFGLCRGAPPITGVVRSADSYSTVVNRSDTDNMGSKPMQGTDVYNLCYFCMQEPNDGPILSPGSVTKCLQERHINSEK